MPPKKDFTQIAFAVVQQVTADEQTRPPVKSDKAVKAGSKGGLARKEKLSDEERRRIASEAAKARWHK